MPPAPDADLADLRRRLAEVDRDLLELAARRLDLAAAIGAVKDRAGGALQDPRQEDAVLARARAQAEALGIPPALAEDLLRTLMRHALGVQERQRLAGTGRGAGRRAVVIGGAGRMGAWCARFLHAQGFAVVIADPAAPVGDLAGLPHVADWRTLSLDGALVIVAATLQASNTILHDLAARRPDATVLDIGSLKAPLRAGLEACRAAGLRVASLHPMFGPSADLLAGRHVLVCDCGSPAATAEAAALFDGTTAKVVHLPLDAHDPAMARVLGLSHAVNIVFLEALAAAEADAAAVRGLSSSTFAAQLAVADRLAAENPRLYFEIQQLNPCSGDVLAALTAAATRLQAAVAAGDEADFLRMLARGRAWSEAGQGGPPA